MEQMDLNHILAYNLRVYRVKKGLSEKDFAALIDLPPYYVSRIETTSCSISVRTVDKIAKNLGIPAYKLFMPPKEDSQSTKN